MNTMSGHYARFATVCTLGFVLSACGGGGGGGGGTTPTVIGSPLPPAQLKTPPPNVPAGHFGLAIFGDDGYGPGNLQIAALFDSSGAPVANPVVTKTLLPFMFDIEDVAISSDGSYGLVADGARTLRIMSGFASGAPAVSSTTLDLSATGNDLDAVRIFENDDEAVVSMDTKNELLLVSGLLSGKPQTAQSIATPDLRNGLALSSDDAVLLARGYTGVTVYAVSAAKPVQGPLGGWVYHSFAQTQNVTAVPRLDSADARAGMASDPADSSRAIVVGGGPSLVELTCLPSAANATAAIPITGARDAFSVTISPDGTTAYVGTDSGIAVFTGINTGTPTQVQSDTIAVAGGDTLQQLSDVAMTQDGKYVVAVGRSTLNPSGSNGYLVVLPVTSGGLGAPVTTVPGVAVPDNNQIVVQ